MRKTSCLLYNPVPVRHALLRDRILTHFSDDGLHVHVSPSRNFDCYRCITRHGIVTSPLRRRSLDSHRSVSGKVSLQGMLAPH